MDRLKMTPGTDDTKMCGEGMGKRKKQSKKKKEKNFEEEQADLKNSKRSRVNL